MSASEGERSGGERPEEGNTGAAGREVRRPEDHETYLQHPNPRVRENLADNPHIEESTLEALSRDEKADVRIRVVARRGVPEEILETLARDRNMQVRLAVLRRDQIPAVAVRALLSDGDPHIWEAVGRREDLPPEALVAIWETRTVTAHRRIRALQRQEHLDGELLDRIAREAPGEDLWMVTSHPEAAPETIQYVSESRGGDGVRAAVLSKWATAEMLERAWRRERSWVRSFPSGARRLFEHPNCPDDVLIDALCESGTSAFAAKAVKGREDRSDRLWLAYKLSHQYQGNPEGLREALDSILGECSLEEEGLEEDGLKGEDRALRAA